MIYVHNLRTERYPEAWNHRRVDRESFWGNTFRMRNKSETERERVIDQYERCLVEELKRSHYGRTNFWTQFEILMNIAMEADLHLYCWCHPLPCHADVLAKYIELELEKLPRIEYVGSEK